MYEYYAAYIKVWYEITNEVNGDLWKAGDLCMQQATYKIYLPFRFGVGDKFHITTLGVFFLLSIRSYIYYVQVSLQKLTKKSWIWQI